MLKFDSFSRSWITVQR